MSSEQTRTTTPTNDTRRSPSCSPEAHQRAGGGHGVLYWRVGDGVAVADGVFRGVVNGGLGVGVLGVGEAQVVERARGILARRLRVAGSVFERPQAVRDYLMMQLAGLEHEVFGVLWLNAQNALIADEPMFRGSLTQSSVYPREVVKSALFRNAAAGILYHNHPSGVGDPSTADRTLTRTLRDALALIDVRILDHMIVAGAAEPFSFAERGLM